MNNTKMKNAMKKTLIAFSTAAIGLCACAEIAAINVTQEPQVCRRACKVLHVDVISPELGGTCEVKSVSELETTTNIVTVTRYMRGFGTIAASTGEVGDWNEITTRAVTNSVESVVLNGVITNSISGLITCSYSVGSATPENKYIPYGDIIFYEGTDDCRVIMYVER